jgi:Zn-dependent metalloprotease
LRYHGQSGALNEAFSDMADKSVEYFEYGKNNWTIDDELLKDGGRALRFMDDPPKDCEGKKQGEECSIGHFKDYKKSLNIHHSSGVFNKAFYLIATAWDTRKAFEVMVQANMHYWTTTTNFAKAACGVVKAARDYKYDEKTIKDAMRAVGVTTSKC